MAWSNLRGSGIVQGEIGVREAVVWYEKKYEVWFHSAKEGVCLISDLANHLVVATACCLQ